MYHALPQPRPGSGIPNQQTDNQEDNSCIGRMANDIVRPRRDELVVFEEGNVECEVSSHHAKAPVPDRGAQHHQEHGESGCRGKSDAVWMLAIWQKESFDQMDSDFVVPAKMMQSSIIAKIRYPAFREVSD